MIFQVILGDIQQLTGDIYQIICHISGDIPGDIYQLIGHIMQVAKQGRG